MHVVFLPATEPNESSYGQPPLRLVRHPDICVHSVTYPRQVWYNPEIRKEAVAQMRSFTASPLVLVGFSKSGLGAWNLTREHPALIAATLIFDVPMTLEDLPDWGTQGFYRDDAAWKQDLPLYTAEAFHAAMPSSHPLILISGERFHDQMHTMSRVLSDLGREHVFLPRPHLKHHWCSGWIEEGLNALQTF